MLILQPPQDKRLALQNLEFPAKAWKLFWN